MSEYKDPDLYRDFQGVWTAVTSVPMGADGVLKLRTTKRGGAVVTTATYHTVDGNATIHALYRDFSTTVVQAKQRCTERAVVLQHESARKCLPEILRECAEHQARVNA